MNLLFGDKNTESIWKGIRIRKLPLEIQNVGRKKLRMLNNTQSLNDLRVPPSNKLEKLGGSNDFYSIRIDDQWRIVFNWFESQSENVTILDYH